jgi:cytochrome b6-f complex iron-sulfur subunit
MAVARDGIGVSRRELLRRSLGAGVFLVLAEWLAGTLGFLWPQTAIAGLRVRVGTLADIEAANPGLPVADGFPAYVPQAKAFVVLVEPGDGFRPGSDATGTGAGVNVIALSQRCPHLGCRPEPCLEDWWMHCPCHQSRYDRLGIKPAGLTYGPAPRSMDRYAVEVSDTGVLTVDMARIVMGPLPIALGQPGVIPPRVEHGCL